ncbi:MAG: hypothetical protein Tp1111DCM298921_41 [Prokaryotic dsDNA virus sp.]|nr:MAG: hypothetical protein Tp1111DCM298921_41 [Prokaryotic dsDNA virus sp.]|tara:strand:- start:48 stop:392 length:345 start_codon:yes stop_codon:yes gene_type:complete
MANTYAWDCKTVDCYPTKDSKSDVVYNVHWRLNATSDQNDPEGNPYAASFYGTQGVSTDDLSNFKPFADLTNAIVTGWVETAMGADEVASLKSGLDANIVDQITPTTETKTVGG